MNTFFHLSCRGPEPLLRAPHRPSTRTHGEAKEGRGGVFYVSDAQKREQRRIQTDLILLASTGSFTAPPAQTTVDGRIEESGANKTQEEEEELSD